MFYFLIFISFFSICCAEPKRILVTGGAGFIGSHLCERLLKRGEKVICLDNFNTGKKQNIEPLLKHPQFSFIEHDIIEPISIEVDEIYHLACPCSPPKYQKDPIQTLKTCFMGSYNLLELARKCKARIFFASTSEIYGDALTHPQKESYWGNVNPVGVRACYDEGKRVSETLFFDYYRQFGIEIRVARIFNTYGPKMDIKDGRIIPNLLVQALGGSPLTIYGDGTQTRSFCYVDDLIDAIVLFMENSKGYQGPLNLGNPQEFSILDLAKIVMEMTQTGSSMFFQPLPLDDPKHRKPDISLAKELLGWEPKIKLREGLTKTIQYYSQNGS